MKIDQAAILSFSLACTAVIDPALAGNISITSWVTQPGNVTMVGDSTYTNANQGNHTEPNNLLMTDFFQAGGRQTTLYFSDADPGKAITSFTATLNMEIHHPYGKEWNRADGFSFYFGPLPTGEFGESPSSANALVARAITYSGSSTKGYSLGVNGVDLFNTAGGGEIDIDNGWMTLKIEWDGTTLTLKENNVIVGSMSTTGFTPQPGYVFAMGARTGGTQESVKISTTTITTTVAETTSPLATTSVTRDGSGNIIIGFSGAASTTYQVTKSVDLVTPFGPLTIPLTATTNAAGVGTATVPAAEASEASEFYRIEILP